MKEFQMSMRVGIKDTAAEELKDAEHHIENFVNMDKWSPKLEFISDVKVKETAEEDVKEAAARIVDLFDKLLADEGIVIPCVNEKEEAERIENEYNYAHLYGTKNWDLVKKVEAIIKDFT